MINVRIERSETNVTSRVTFDFDGVYSVTKWVSATQPNSYELSLRYREARRDFLYHFRSAFGPVERRMENVLFRLAGT